MASHMWRQNTVVHIMAHYGRAGRGYFHGTVNDPKLDYWYRTCFGIDIKEGLVTVALNGQIMDSNRSVGNLVENKPTSLNKKVVLGKWNRTSTGLIEQYPWSVTNLQIFHWVPGLELGTLSGNECLLAGDYMSWDSMEWGASGDDVSVVETENNDVCREVEEGRYNLALPFGKTQDQALSTCHKLGHAWLTSLDNQEQYEQFIAWFDRITNKTCKRIWTPYSDKREEGVFVNVDDGSPVTFLPWAVGDPNGGKIENGIAINIARYLQTRNK